MSPTSLRPYEIASYEDMTEQREARRDASDRTVEEHRALQPRLKAETRERHPEWFS